MWEVHDGRGGLEHRHGNGAKRLFLFDDAVMCSGAGWSGSLSCLWVNYDEVSSGNMVVWRKRWGGRTGH